MGGYLTVSQCAPSYLAVQNHVESGRLLSAACRRVEISNQAPLVVKIEAHAEVLAPEAHIEGRVPLIFHKHHGVLSQSPVKQT